MMKINESLGYLIGLTNRHMKRELDNKLKEFNITTSQFACLKLLSEEEKSLTQVEIASKLRSDKVTAGAVIDKLIAKGLVSRERNIKDKRAYVIEITDDGLSVVKNTVEAAASVNRKALKGLSEEEVDSIVFLLNKINKNFMEE
ncbi:MarR family winged helix-turn-helix transcriptional regulator [Inconstantimicrobium porci]|uniref:MarR family winged helix-turn-helix transcriptional regulator n=1 Tax=Inconstantimicrobium porci TaxID=2652291 RepID=UPI0024092C05|nr:MarR family transcriptional regulator [Inconstantimicrobium porci]MDD6771483.1 MarR family transcriptional regulator [Inconstantimicrobium porci]